MELRCETRWNVNRFYRILCKFRTCCSSEVPIHKSRWLTLGSRLSSSTPSSSCCLSFASLFCCAWSLILDSFSAAFFSAFRRLFSSLKHRQVTVTQSFVTLEHQQWDQSAIGWMGWRAGVGDMTRITSLSYCILIYKFANCLWSKIKLKTKIIIFYFVLSNKQITSSRGHFAQWQKVGCGFFCFCFFLSLTHTLDINTTNLLSLLQRHPSTSEGTVCRMWGANFCTRNPTARHPDRLAALTSVNMMRRSWTKKTHTSDSSLYLQPPDLYEPSNTFPQYSTLVWISFHIAQN